MDSKDLNDAIVLIAMYFHAVHTGHAASLEGARSEKEPLSLIRHLMSTDPLGSYPGPPKITKPFDIRGIIPLPIVTSSPLPSYPSILAPASSPFQETSVPAYASGPIIVLPSPQKADVKPSGRVCVCNPLTKPVCGTDGMTYSNACRAMCEGVTIASKGACPLPK